MKAFLRNNGLSLVLFTLFLIILAGQSLVGHAVENDELEEHGRAPVSYVQYLQSGAFLEVTMENWESEFFQMFGSTWFSPSSCSRRVRRNRSSPTSTEAVDRDPRLAAQRRMRRGRCAAAGGVLRLYENSLSLAFPVALPDRLRAATPSAAHAQYNEEQRCTASRAVTTVQYLAELAVLVRVVPELAERIPRHLVHGGAEHFPAPARLARIQARRCAAFRDGVIADHSAGRARHGSFRWWAWLPILPRTIGSVFRTRPIAIGPDGPIAPYRFGSPPMFARLSLAFSLFCLAGGRSCLCRRTAGTQCGIFCRSSH